MRKSIHQANEVFRLANGVWVPDLDSFLLRIIQWYIKRRPPRLFNAEDYLVDSSISYTLFSRSSVYTVTTFCRAARCLKLVAPAHVSRFSRTSSNAGPEACAPCIRNLTNLPRRTQANTVYFLSLAARRTAFFTPVRRTNGTVSPTRTA